MKHGLTYLLVIAGLQLAIGPSAFAEESHSTPPPLESATAEGFEIDYQPGESVSAAPMTSATASGSAPSERPGPIPFNGGYVQHHPRIYLIFYGSDWSKHTLVKEQILQLYNWLPGSSYQSLLTQYFDFSGYVTDDVGFSASYTDTRVAYPAHLNNDVIKEEIQYSINSRGWGQTSYENQYVVALPPGPEPSQLWEVACAAHGWSGQFAWIGLPWSLEGCQRGLSVGNAMQVSASHEYSEAVTDPIPTENYWGWQNEKSQGEIADICNTGTPAEQAEVAPGVFAAKIVDDYLWAATGNRCVAQDLSPARFGVQTTAPFFPTPHTAALTGTVNPAGWGANYNFALSGLGGTRYLPSERNGQFGLWYGFTAVPNAFTPQIVSAQATNLKGNTSYEARLDANGPITLPTSYENFGDLQNIGGGTVSFTTPDWRPAVTTEPATAVKGHSATLHGTVNPEGTQTTYQFEYGPTTGYGANVPVPAGSVGAGATAAAIENAVTGLEEATIYHYRISASNEEGTSYGEDREFRTPGKPIIVASEARYTNTFEPRLGGSISPDGAATGYQVEYGPTTAYGSKAPATAVQIGSGLPSVTVGEYVGPLPAGATYHFRVVAENEVGTTIGQDASFTTPPPCRGAEGKCAWSTQATAEPPPFTEDEFKAVSCPSTTLCLAVGRNGYTKGSFLERWNGSAWSLQENVTGEMRQISCPTTIACVAIGVGGSGAAQSWMINPVGGGWTVSPLSPPLPPGASQSTLSGISCTAGACTAVGSYRDSGGTYKSLIERWNGSTWSLQEAPNPPEGSAQNAMLAVSCPIATFCFASGEAAGKPVAELWTGSSWVVGWALLPSGSTAGKLVSVVCSGQSLCTLAGSYGKVGAEKTLVERWTPSGFTIQSSPNPAEAQGFVNFSSLSCPSSSSCSAVGYYASKVEAETPVEVKTLAESWNGTSWTIKSTPNSPASKYSALAGISCFATATCTALGAGEPGPLGETEVNLAESWNGSSWSTQSAVNPAPLTEDELKDIACISSSCLAVGWNNYAKNSFLETSSGTTWSLGQNVQGEVKGVSCSASSLCVAVGADAGAAQTWILNQVNETGWAVAPNPPPLPAGATQTVLKDISCFVNSCTAVGSYRNSAGAYRPLIERTTGSGWFLQEAPDPAEGNAEKAMLSVSCAPAVSCAAVGEAAGKPVAETWNGTSWSQSSLPALPVGATSGKFSSVSCPAADSCFAAGYSAEKTGAEKPLVEAWNGTSWSIIPVPSPAEAQGFTSLSSISCLSPRACFAAGSYASKVEAGNPLETKPMIESLSATQWTLQSPAAVAGFKFSGLTGVSCTSVVACTTVGAKTTALHGQPVLTLAERYG